MSRLARSVVESGIALVEVIKADRDEFARGLWTQGYDRDRADRLAASIPDYDAALQMLARHRMTYEKPGPTDWISDYLTPDQRESLFACLHGVQCGSDVREIPEAMERIISLFHASKALKPAAQGEGSK